MPSGVLRLIALTTRSLLLPDGRLSTGKAERTPAIPAVIFWWIHQSSSTKEMVAVEAAHQMSDFHDSWRVFTLDI